VSSLFDEMNKYVNNSKDSDVPETSDISKTTKSNLEKGAFILSKKLVDAVNSDSIKVRDIKDVKDIVSIFQMLASEGESTSNHPAVSINLAKLYSSTAGLPDDTKPKPVELEKSLDNMSEDDVAKLVKKQADILNKDNGNEF